MENILIGTKNPHKQQKLTSIVGGYFEPLSPSDLPDVEEHGETFEAVARNKAAEYSLLRRGYAIATDGGAVFPALNKDEWNPIHTKRFAETDEDRIAKLLALLQNKADRTVEWHEAIAVAKDGVVLFSATARAMDGIIDRTFDPKKYQEGIWLCSITSFPQFGGRNFFDLTPAERELTEYSWTRLADAFRERYVRNRE